MSFWGAKGRPENEQFFENVPQRLLKKVKVQLEKCSLEIVYATKPKHLTCLGMKPTDKIRRSSSYSFMAVFARKSKQQKVDVM